METTNQPIDPQLPDENTQADVPADEQELLTPAPLPQYVQHHRPIAPSTRASSDTVPLPSNTRAGVNAAVQGQKMTDQVWGKALTAGVEMTPQNDGLVGAVVREGADWTDMLGTPPAPMMLEHFKLAAGSGTFANTEDLRHALRARRQTGLPTRVPLYHSGFWLRINAPSENELISFYMEIVNDEIQMGRSTGGLIFSSTTGHYQERLMRLALKNVHSSSLNVDPENLGKYIQMQDIPVVIWGLGAAQYPTGFKYSRACSAGPATCSHVHSETLNLTELHIVDRSRLSEADRLHMARRTAGTHTVEEVLAYQKRAACNQPKDIVIGNPEDNLVVRLKMPNIEEYFDAKDLWIDSISDMLSATIKTDPALRNKTMFAHGRATILRQYAHLVDALIMDEREYSKRDEVNVVLDELSTDDAVREDIMAHASNFINECVMSMIAVRTYDCPKCGRPQRQVKEGLALPDVLPIDPGQVFFHLLGQKLARLNVR